MVAPLLIGQNFADPIQAYAEATRKTDILALQSGEPGPIAQVIAGVDLALWDLCARRASLPLFRLLGGQQARLPVYASGINPDGPLAVVQRKHAEGYPAFKLKIGFSGQQDLDHLASLRAWLGPQAQQIRQHGLRYCLHYLSDRIGLMASAHVMAAAGGDGLLEIDANDNALRSLLAPPLAQVVDGYISLEEKPGLGVTPDIEALKRACAALSADA